MAKHIQQNPLQLNPQTPNPNPILLSTRISKRVLPKKKKKRKEKSNVFLENLLIKNFKKVLISL